MPRSFSFRFYPFISIHPSTPFSLVYPAFAHHSGFLEGVKHQSLVRGRSPRHRGVYVGEVIAVVDSQSQAQAQTQSLSQSQLRYSKGTRATPRVGNIKGGSSSSSGGSGNGVGVVVELQGPVKRGDGLVFVPGRPPLFLFTNTTPPPPPHTHTHTLVFLLCILTLSVLVSRLVFDRGDPPCSHLVPHPGSLSPLSPPSFTLCI